MDIQEGMEAKEAILSRDRVFEITAQHQREADTAGAYLREGESYGVLQVRYLHDPHLNGDGQLVYCGGSVRDGHSA